MRAVKSNKNKSTEIQLLKILKKYKISGWRRQYKLPGKPDFVFRNYKLVIFTDGCFWHGHNCRNIKPQSNAVYWSEKIKKNKKRDISINKLLKQMGWKVVRIRECELKSKQERVILRKIQKYVY